jgi:predicted ribonuclease YlaK
MPKKISEDSLFFGLNLSDEQKELRDAIYGDNYDIIFCNSRAGTGKSLISIACAKLMVSEGRYNGLKYIFSPCEEDKLGFTPGTTEEKENKYLLPLYDSLLTINESPEKSLITNGTSLAKKNGTAWIEAMSHTFMRGTNISNKIVIMEECQNWKVNEIKKVLTRCHDNSKIIVIGHSGQIDLKNKKESGFEKYIEHFRNEKRCKICTLTINFRGWVANHADELV